MVWWSQTYLNDNSHSDIVKEPDRIFNTDATAFFSIHKEIKCCIAILMPPLVFEVAIYIRIPPTMSTIKTIWILKPINEEIELLCSCWKSARRTKGRYGRKMFKCFKKCGLFRRLSTLQKLFLHENENRAKQRTITL